RLRLEPELLECPVGAIRTAGERAREPGDLDELGEGLGVALRSPGRLESLGSTGRRVVVPDIVVVHVGLRSRFRRSPRSIASRKRSVFARGRYPRAGRRLARA